MTAKIKPDAARGSGDRIATKIERALKRFPLPWTYGLVCGDRCIIDTNGYRVPGAILLFMGKVCGERLPSIRSDPSPLLLEKIAYLETQLWDLQEATSAEATARREWKLETQLATKAMVVTKLEGDVRGLHKRIAELQQEYRKRENLAGFRERENITLTTQLGEMEQQRDELLRTVAQLQHALETAAKELQDVREQELQAVRQTKRPRAPKPAVIVAPELEQQVREMRLGFDQHAAKMDKMQQALEHVVERLADQPRKKKRKKGKKRYAQRQANRDGRQTDPHPGSESVAVELDL